MRILDCESVESTYSSLKTITGVSILDIKDFLKSLDPNIAEKNSSPYINDGILNEFKIRFKTSFDYEYVYWFHLTRTYEGNKFDEGLLPAKESVDRLWNFLFTLIENELSENDWKNFRKDFESCNFDNTEAYHRAYLYNLIVIKLSSGPYAFLVKEQSILKYKNHYLTHPETVMHICYAFYEIFNLDLLSIYSNKTVPCVVKFRSRNTKSTYLGDALHYLHKVSLNRDSGLDDTCFDGNDKKVNSEDIVEIQYFD